MKTKGDNRRKKKKKDRSILEREFMAFLQASLKACINQALDDVLKDFNK